MGTVVRRVPTPRVRTSVSPDAPFSHLCSVGGWPHTDSVGQCRTGARGESEGPALALVESLVSTPQGTLFPVPRSLESDIKLLMTAQIWG